MIKIKLEITGHINKKDTLQPLKRKNRKILQIKKSQIRSYRICEKTCDEIFFRFWNALLKHSELLSLSFSDVAVLCAQRSGYWKFILIFKISLRVFLAFSLLYLFPCFLLFWGGFLLFSFSFSNVKLNLFSVLFPLLI